MQGERGQAAAWQAMEYDSTRCRECGREFNLAVQDYYTNLCPNCKEEE